MGPVSPVAGTVEVWCACAVAAATSTTGFAVFAAVVAFFVGFAAAAPVRDVERFAVVAFPLPDALLDRAAVWRTGRVFTVDVVVTVEGVDSDGAETGAATETGVGAGAMWSWW
jgi:hypothetical protein